MKVVCSSKILKKQLKKAIQEGLKDIELRDNRVCLITGEDVLEVPAEGKGGYYLITPTALQAAKLYAILEHVEEQPIVINDSGSWIGIQFVI